MNILVYNIAAEYAGALTVLKQFYEDVLGYEDKSHQWYFVVSNDELTDCENIKVISVPWTKKSWLHRWYYDRFCAKKLIEEYQIDMVFSMQNMPIHGARCPQVVYLHQSLQFSPVRYSFFKKDERLYWFRQNVICNMMKASLKKADNIIVQTKWMKDATTKWLGDTKSDIQVVSPKISLHQVCEEPMERDGQLFVYPAGDGIHKNHRLIIRACEILKSKGVSYKVLFTLDRDESLYAKELYDEIQRQGLNIEFVGFLSGEDIMRYYKESTLLFPSYLETFGLPLLEARHSNGLIVCSDLPFAHEILDGYPNAYFVQTEDKEKLADYMTRCCKNEIVPVESKEELVADTTKMTLIEQIIALR